MKNFKDVQVGDMVYRYFGGDGIPFMSLIVTDVTDRLIVCDDYTFCIETGAEVDEYLGWNSFGSGSFIKIQ